MAIKFRTLRLAQGLAGNRESLFPWKLSFAISVAVTAVLLLLNATGCFQIVEWAIFDQYFRLRPTEGPDPRLLLVTVDEPDIAQLQRWPLSDEQLAQVLTQLNQFNPRAIGLDVYRDFSVPPGKSALDEVFRTMPNLFGVEKVGNTTVAPPPILAERDQVAIADLLLDGDGRVRRALLSVKLDNQVKLSLGAALALRYLEQGGITLEASKLPQTTRLGEVSFLRLQSDDGGYTNIDSRGYQMLLNYRGPDDAFDSVPITSVLDGQFSADLVRDRIVIIGSIAPSVNDFVYTPYHASALTQTSQSAGVVIHAHIASQIISAVLDSRPLIRTWSTAAEWGWTFLWCSLGSGIILFPQGLRQNKLKSLLAIGLPTAGLGVALLLINGLLFFHGWWVPSLPSLLGIGASAMVGLSASNSKLLKDAYIDGLTNLLNRRAFNQQMVEAQDFSAQLAVILCDVDCFKSFNDSYGHPTGDDCLRKIARSIQQSVRSQDLVARYGGEEFVVILRDASQETACDIAERMRDRVQKCQIPHNVSQANPFVSISCGVATRPRNSKIPLAQILNHADQALYEAKRAGRNRVVLSSQSRLDTSEPSSEL